jgi:hypothetical protein
MGVAYIFINPFPPLDKTLKDPTRPYVSTRPYPTRLYYFRSYQTLKEQPLLPTRVALKT